MSDEGVAGVGAGAGAAVGAAGGSAVGAAGAALPAGAAGRVATGTIFCPGAIGAIALGGYSFTSLYARAYQSVPG